MSDSNESMEVSYDDNNESPPSSPFSENSEQMNLETASMGIVRELAERYSTSDGISYINHPPSTRPSTSSSDSDNDNEADTRKKYKKLLYPQHKTRLFSRIISAKHIEQVVSYWLNEYIADKDKATVILMQLFVDVSTYQHINVKRFLDTHNNAVQDLVTYMEQSKNTVVPYATYFLYVRNKIHMAKIAKIDEFVEMFIKINSKEKILYDFLFTKLVRLLVLMANSFKRAIKHTGVYFAIKFQTGIIRENTKIVEKIFQLKEMIENETDPEILEKLKAKLGKLFNYNHKIEEIVAYLQTNVVNKFVDFRDPKLHFMRLDCILEIYGWIEMFPQRHLNAENLKHIIHATTDNNKIIRYAALDIIGKIMVNYKELVNSKLPTLIDTVGKHIRDVDNNIAILATNIITSVRRFAHIPSNIREMLCLNLYNMYYPVGAASGRYLADCILEKNFDKTDEKLLIFFLAFLQKSLARGFIGGHPAIIESIYDCFPILQDIPAYLKLLESIEMSQQNKELLLQVLLESVYETFKGQSTLVRSSGRKGPINPDAVEKMYTDAMNAGRLLLRYYGTVEKFAPLGNILLEYKRKRAANDAVPEDISLDVTPNRTDFTSGRNVKIVEADEESIPLNVEANEESAHLDVSLNRSDSTPGSRCGAVEIVEADVHTNYAVPDSTSLDDSTPCGNVEIDEESVHLNISPNKSDSTPGSRCGTVQVVEADVHFNYAVPNSTDIVESS